MAVRLTDCFPTVVHPCAEGALGVLRFTGTAKDGLEGTCSRCFITYRYVKPRPRRGLQPAQGGRTHF